MACKHGNPVYKCQECLPDFVEVSAVDRLQGWLLTQRNAMAPITKAADALNVSVSEIRQTVAESYWIGLEVHDGIEHAALDGE